MFLVQLARLVWFYSQSIVFIRRVPSWGRRRRPLPLLAAALLLMPAGASAASFVFERTFDVPGVTRIDGLAYIANTAQLMAVNAAFTDALYLIELDGTLLSTHYLDFTEGSRSLAYSAVSDSLFIGEYGVGSIYETTLTGDLIRSFEAPLYNNNSLSRCDGDALQQGGRRVGHDLSAGSADGCHTEFVLAAD